MIFVYSLSNLRITPRCTVDKRRLSARNVSQCLSCLMSLICCVYTYLPVKFTDPLRVCVYTELHKLNIRLFVCSTPRTTYLAGTTRVRATVCVCIYIYRIINIYILTSLHNIIEATSSEQYIIIILLLYRCMNWIQCEWKYFLNNIKYSLYVPDYIAHIKYVVR